MHLWLVATIVFLMNIPFGIWRDRSRKFSWQWILAIHLPVPMIIGLRLVSGLGFQLYTFPVMIGAFFLGQYAGGRINRFRGAGNSNRNSN
jgi:hypothetical protein